MNVKEFKSSSGKSYIRKYLDALSADEKSFGYAIISHLEEYGLEALEIKHWQGKIYEIYFYKHNRIFYITQNNNDIYLLHACRKQKNKTEKIDKEIVIKRAKILEKELNKKFI